MTYHIIACGETGKHWNGEGLSIGVNDAEKWGYKLNNLVIVNAPNQFQPSRLDVILKSKPGKVWSNMPHFWDKHFSNIERLNLLKWSKGEKIRQGVIHHAYTSPFVAMSLAYNLGAQKVVLWGVDFVTHPNFGKGASKHVNEMILYQSYTHALKAKGVEVFIGARGTSFDNILPVYENLQKV
jgi:hypothetical protein